MPLSRATHPHCIIRVVLVATPQGGTHHLTSLPRIRILLHDGWPITITHPFRVVLDSMAQLGFHSRSITTFIEQEACGGSMYCRALTAGLQGADWVKGNNPVGAVGCTLDGHVLQGGLHCRPTRCRLGGATWMHKLPLSNSLSAHSCSVHGYCCPHATAELLDVYRAKLLEVQHLVMEGQQAPVLSRLQYMLSDFQVQYIMSRL